jgi:acetoin utilization deacetylase AcuC-like enzyme
MIPTVYSEDFLTDYVTVDCESPDRIWIIQSRIQHVAEFTEPEPCMAEDLLLCHGHTLIKTVQKDETVYEIARKAAGGAIKAADYRRIGHRLASSNPRLFAVLEGGYFIPDLGANARAFLEGMQDSCL